MIRIGSRRVFTTEIRIVQVMTQLTDGRRRKISPSLIIIWSGHCRSGRTYCTESCYWLVNVIIIHVNNKIIIEINTCRCPVVGCF